MVQSENSNEKFAKELLIKACYSTFSLWNKSRKSFIRNVKSCDLFYPTATLHGISSLLECGFYISEKKPKHFKEIEPKSIPLLIDIIEGLDINDKEWVVNFLKKSSHIKDMGGNENTGENEPKFGVRSLIIIERFLKILDGLCDDLKRKKYFKDGVHFLEQIIQKVIKENEKDNGKEIENDKLFPDEGISPLPLLNLTLCISHLKSLKGKLEIDDDLVKYNEKLERLVMNHINFHMARNNSKNEPSFDPVSLSTALYAASILSPGFKYTPFFNSCLQVIVANQNPNGCWPSGISISYSENGDVVQLPSVEIATFLAEAVIDENILIDTNDGVNTSLNIVIPAFRNFAKFLGITYQHKLKGTETYYGWASDRIGGSDFIETWITAQATRFLHRYWLAEKALFRNHSLKSFGVNEFKAKFFNHTKQQELESDWNKNIIEPDHTIFPAQKIFKEYILPVVNQKKPGNFILYPNKDHMSFIIFGPPGSGKTYFIEQMVRMINWPLVELSPGQFIKNGVELIESTTKEIFDLLNNLNHAVVFFDECDELFRSRDGENSATRTILSFATASMLPKLQKLHDKGQIILVLGTNYLQNIDQAIKRPGRFDDIILYDRPDAESRKKHIINCFKEKKNEKNDSDIKKLVESTEFYTINEIYKRCSQDEELKDSTVPEYKEWCKETGVCELYKSRYNEKERVAIIKRWGLHNYKSEKECNNLGK